MILAYVAVVKSLRNAVDKELRMFTTTIKLE